MDDHLSIGKMRHIGRSTLTVANANYASWICTSRTVLLLIFVLILGFLEVMGTREMLALREWQIGAVETIYHHLAYGCNILMSSVMFFVMISELPQRISFQNYAFIRSSRMQWLVGQIVYCIEMVCTMIMLLALCSFFFSLGSIDFSWGWSDKARVAEGMPENFALAHAAVRNAMPPLQAIFYAALPLFFFWFSMAMVILACSLSGAPAVGLLICAVALLSSVIVNTLAFASEPTWLPLRYATLRSILDIGLPYGSIIAGYTLLNGAIILFMFLRIRKADMTFHIESNA